MNFIFHQTNIIMTSKLYIIYVYTYRIFIVIMCMLSVAWLPLVQTSHSGQLFIYVVAIQGYLASPISALFLVGVLWKRMTEPVRLTFSFKSSEQLIKLNINFLVFVTSKRIPNPNCRIAILSVLHHILLQHISH